MKKLDLGEAIGILANLGVIAGIVFLGIELRQNNELLAAESRSSRAERAIELLLLASNRDLAAVLAKLNDGADLDSTDQVQLRSYAISVFRGFEANFDEIQIGNLDEDSLLRAQRSVVRNEGGPAAPIPWHDYWLSYKGRSTPEFVQWMDRRVFAVNE